MANIKHSILKWNVPQNYFTKYQDKTASTHMLIIIISQISTFRPYHNQDQVMKYLQHWCLSSDNYSKSAEVIVYHSRYLAFITTWNHSQVSCKQLWRKHITDTGIGTPVSTATDVLILRPFKNEWHSNQLIKVPYSALFFKYSLDQHGCGYIFQIWLTQFRSWVAYGLFQLGSWYATFI